MTISSVSSLTPTTAAAPVTAPVTAAQPTDPTDAETSVAASSNLSTMGQLMSQLQSLTQTDPDQAKTVLAKIGTDLSATNPALASKFTQASQTGDLSALQPKDGAGGHHHHHHHGGGSPSTQASSYDQSSDPTSEIESVISNALQST